ncbi:bacteriocin-type signal sequence [Desulfovibrio piger]|nr:bacteriocin-type signal sequence [Desulfovibrio piger]
MSEKHTEAKFHEEVKSMEYEPLDETEMKLVHWSWGLGVGLLIVLFLISKFVMTTH